MAKSTATSVASVQDIAPADLIGHFVKCVEATQYSTASGELRNVEFTEKEKINKTTGQVYKPVLTTTLRNRGGQRITIEVQQSGYVDFIAWPANVRKGVKTPPLYQWPAVPLSLTEDRKLRNIQFLNTILASTDVGDLIATPTVADEAFELEAPESKPSKKASK